VEGVNVAVTVQFCPGVKVIAVQVLALSLKSAEFVPVTAIALIV
jgi:hypothetical protein